MKKRLFSILLSLSVMLIGILAMSTTAMAATDKVEGIQAEQTVDTSSGNIKVTLKVTAEDGYNIEGLALENKAPNGYKLFSGEATKKIAELKSGKSEILTTVFTKETGAVKTGDSNSNHMLMYGGLAILSAALIVLLLSRKKKGHNKMFMLLLCCVMVASGAITFTGTSFALEGKQINFSKNVTVGSETVTVKSVVSYDRIAANEYTVTFDMQGHGNAPEAYTNVKYGSTINAPTTPTDEGYTFGGWYKDAECNNEWKFDTDKVTANTTLYAKWTANTYTVKFDANGGSGSMDHQTFTYGVSQNLTENSFAPSEGKAFLGWNTDQAAEEALYADKEEVSNLTSENNGEVTLYAIWASTYTVTFDLNGISGTAPTSLTIQDGKKVTKPADPTDTIHTFAGWYKTKDAITGALSDPWDFDNGTVTADMTLYAKWTRTLGSIYGTNENVPKSDNNSAPDNAWKNGNDGKAFIAYSGKSSEVLYLYKQLQPSGAKQLSCRKAENFTKIGDDYVLDYYLSSSFYGKYTLHMTEGKLTSVTYNGAGTEYEVLSGTYAAPATHTVKFYSENFEKDEPCFDCIAEIKVADGEKIPQVALGELIKQLNMEDSIENINWREMDEYMQDEPLCTGTEIYELDITEDLDIWVALPA